MRVPTLGFGGLEVTSPKKGCGCRSPLAGSSAERPGEERPGRVTLKYRGDTDTQERR